MQNRIEIPIILQNTEKEVKEVTGRIYKSEVSYYYPGFFEGSIIVMKCGHSFMTPLAVNAIDTLLNC